MNLNHTTQASSDEKIQSSDTAEIESGNLVTILRLVNGIPNNGSVELKIADLLEAEFIPGSPF